MLARLLAVLVGVAYHPAASHALWTNHLDRTAAPAALQSGLDRVQGWGDPKSIRWAEDVVDLAGRIAAREPAELPSQLTHGDFWDDNVLFDGPRVAGVLDFGFVVRRPRIDDLALPAWFHRLDQQAAGTLDADLAVLDAMADAYNQAADRPLTAAKHRALPLEVARQCLWALGVWVRGLPEPEAQAHATTAVLEFAVASSVFAAADLLPL